MTGVELQSRMIRSLEDRYAALVAANLAAGLDPEQAHESAFHETLRLWAEALEELRRRGLFPFPLGEIPSRRAGAA